MGYRLHELPNDITRAAALRFLQRGGLPSTWYAMMNKLWSVRVVGADGAAFMDQAWERIVKTDDDESNIRYPNQQF